MNTSLGEKILRELVKSRYKRTKILYNHRPESLRNPKTNRKLELDIYLPRLRLAFEFQGTQHAWFYQSFKDEVKVVWAEKHGVKLIKVWGKDLLKTAERFAVEGAKYTDELTKLLVAYHAKTYWMNKRLRIKSKGNGYAQKKARFHLKVKSMAGKQKAEDEFGRTKMARRAELKRTREQRIFSGELKLHPVKQIKLQYQVR